MHTTMFDTPIIKTILRVSCISFLKVCGWKKEGRLPDIPKYVMIAAPHTTNWDLPFMLFLSFWFRLKMYWMGKEEMFRWPFGPVMKWLGGIPVNRSQSNNLVDYSVQIFNEQDNLVLTVPPEGTRKKVPYWKTGFYHIAHGANVPVLMGFLDYKRKAGGFGPVLYPTGNIKADMKIVKEFYANVTGKYPNKTTDESIKSKAKDFNEKCS